MNFLRELKKRNALLFWFGMFNLAMAVLCIALMPFEEVKILGVNRWLKPFKFYLSVGIVILTLGWLMYYLNNQKSVKVYSLIMTIVMFFENGLIIMQAARKTTSHFNITSAFNGIVFSLMGILIMIFTFITILVCISFFRQTNFTITPAYVWGIRLGILFFIIFSLEGGMMVSIMKHTVGDDDGGPGLPIVNWSIQYGDLRIAHFLGLHSLQVLPLFGNYVSKTKTQTIVFSIGYILLCSLLLLQAINGIPLFF
jgi:hypothetical protein